MNYYEVDQHDIAQALRDRRAEKAAEQVRELAEHSREYAMEQAADAEGYDPQEAADYDKGTDG